MHDALIKEMDRVIDPMRGWIWADRPWRSVGRFSYWARTIVEVTVNA